LGWGPLNFERRESPPSSNCLPAGATEHLIFVSLASGHVTRESDGESAEHELSPGYVAIQPSGRPVRWVWDTRLHFGVISLDPAFLERVAEQVFGLQPAEFELVPAERAHDPVIANIAGVLSRETVRADAGGRVYAESLANILAVHLLRNYTAGAQEQRPAEQAEPQVRHLPRSRAVADAIRYIEAHYAEEITLGDIAATVHLSSFHLSRLFKQVTGLSPRRYLIQVRVNSARALLSAGSGQRSLADVAAAVGFADQSHLTRHFKRQFGVTPKHFR
jgi:AraC family transcriptional regulator